MARERPAHSDHATDAGRAVDTSRSASDRCATDASRAVDTSRSASDRCATDAGRATLRRRARSPRFWAACFALWVCFVWGHSLMDGDISSAESSRFAFLLWPWLVPDIDLATFIIRKCAHFTEYAVLGLITWQLRWSWLASVQGRTSAPAPGPSAPAPGTSAPASRVSRRVGILPLALMVAIPVLDESIQLAVPGRSGSPRDVAIDLAGACTGLLVSLVVRAIRGRRRG